MKLKEKLLNLGIVINNNYLDQYCELINLNLDTAKQKCKTNKHHIIPRCYFKENNLPVDDSAENTVHLTYADHFLAHYYLSLCSIGKFKYYNELAISYIQSKYNITIEAVLQNPEEYQQLREDLALKKSQIKKGKPFPHTPEWQAKLNAAYQARRGIPTGRSPWNKGKKGLYRHTTEEIEKIRQASTGRQVSLETREKLRVATLGNQNKVGYKASKHTCELQSRNNGRNRMVQCIETGEIFYNINECARQLMMHPQIIRKLIVEERPLTSRVIKSWSVERKRLHDKYYGCNFRFYQEE